MLRRNGLTIDQDAVGGEFDDYKDEVNSVQRMETDLKLIAALGADYSSHILHEFLTEAGWTPNDFQRSRSRRDRAAYLMCNHQGLFDIALAMWNGNRLRARVEQENGFRLPENLPAHEFETLTLSEESYLRGLLQSVMSEHYPGKEVSKVGVFERKSVGLPTGSETVIQCDISFGDDPEAIAILDQGEERTISISRLAKISAILDPQAGTIFVATTELKKKKLHAGIAQVITQVLYADSTIPQKLGAVRVFPEKCGEAIEFQYSVDDQLTEPRVTELDYRLFGAPNSLQFRVRHEDSSPKIHELRDVRRDVSRMRIWRAGIDFIFHYEDGAKPIKRHVTLIEPAGIKFAKAFPEERMIIERILQDAGLIDKSFRWSRVTRLNGLLRLATPQHLAELKDSWSTGTVSALIDAGILIQGPPHERAWCRRCGASHPVQALAFNGEEKRLQMLCPNGVRPVQSDELDTLIMSLDGLVSWLMREGSNDRHSQESIGRDGTSFFLGRVSSENTAGLFQLIFCLDVDQAQASEDLNDFLLNRHADGPGMIVTLSSNPVHKNFPHGWKVVPFHKVVRLAKAGLVFDMRKASAVMSGRPIPKKQMSEEDWAEIDDLFECMFPGTEKLQKHTVAKAMIETEPDVCRTGQRNLANHLAKKFADRFN